MSVLIPVLLAALFMQGGFVAWKIFSNRAETLQPKVIVRSPLWWLGLVSMAIGWMLFIKATDIMDITLVQPVMSGADMLLAILFSVLFLKERLHRWEGAGVGLIFAGAFIVSLHAQARRPEAIHWAHAGVVFLALVVAGSAGVFYSTKSESKEIPLSLSVGAAFCGAALLTKLMTAHLYLNGKPLGAFMTVVDPFLVGALAINGLGVALLMRAFKHGRSAVVVPVELAISNALVFVGAAFIFGERLTPSRSIGLLLILAGTTLLHGFASLSKHSDDERPDTLVEIEGGACEPSNP